MYFKAKFFDGFKTESNVPQQIGKFSLKTIENAEDAEAGTKYAYSDTTDITISAYVFRNIGQTVPTGIESTAINTEFLGAIQGVIQVAPHIGWEDVTPLEPMPKILGQDPHNYLWGEFKFRKKRQKRELLVLGKTHVLVRGSAGYFNKLRCSHSNADTTKKQQKLEEFAMIWAATLEEMTTKK